MQENNFFLSALQPENGVCSLALPSDQQLGRKHREAPESELLKSARVQEQVRMRMLQKSQAAPRANGGAGLDYAELRGRQPRWARGGGGGTPWHCPQTSSWPDTSGRPLNWSVAL